MRIFQKIAKFRIVPAAFVSISFGAGFLFAIRIGDARARRADKPERPVPIRLERASASEPSRQQPPTSEPPPLAPAKIHIDATRLLEVDAGRIRQLRERLASLNPQSGSGSADEPGGAPDLDNWSRLDAPPAAITLYDKPEGDRLDSYAVRARSGTTVFLCNNGGDKLSLKIKVRLLPGIYTLERLTFTPKSQAVETAPATALSSLPAPAAARYAARLERLQGRDFSSAQVNAFPWTLQPGQICLFRFTDSTFQARTAMNELRSQLRLISKGSPELSGRLHLILDELGSYEHALSPSAHLSTDSRLSAIHRCLLVLGQAQSLHKNFLVRRSVSATPGAAFMNALERLNDALADTSATLIGLVPEIEISSPSHQEAVKVRPVLQTDAAQETPHVVHVTVALANTGSRRVDNVKIGMDSSSLPEEVHCQPEDPALFDSLSPGQTVRATYRLQWMGTAAPKTNRFAGNVSYFAAGAPAHLRPRTW